MSDTYLGALCATFFTLAIIFAHWVGMAGAEAGIVLDCATMQSFRTGRVVYECKKKETQG